MDWQAVRTARNTYSAQFDLMKDVRVRVYTLLSGPCTNGSMIKSSNFTELVRQPSDTGKFLKLKHPTETFGKNKGIVIYWCYSKCRCCGYSSPGLCLCVPQYEVHGM